MITFPPCKINLGLNIVRKRPDGYHDIETCFYPVPWTDILEIIPASKFSFTTSGIHIPGKEEDNLCVKAYTLLKTQFHLPPVEMHLHKIIPSGAGLGGGSSDAAHVLRLLNQLFRLSLSDDALQEYASRLGSDCAFFIQDDPKLGTERGNVLSNVQVSLKGKFLVLVKPTVHISTADAYAGVTPSIPDMEVKTILQKPIAEWKQFLKNDFELSVFKKFPALKSLKDNLYDSGAIYASMSGSGSSVFGIFDQPTDLRHTFPNMDFWSGTLTR